MVSVDKAVIAKVTKGGQKFEILVDPEKAMEVKAGKDVPLNELLAVNDIWEDSKKGLKVSPKIVSKNFGTNDLQTVVLKIIKDGSVQLTTEQRNKMLEEKTRLIANIIARQGINPQTKTPHPVDRILTVIKQSKVKIVLGKRPEEQIDEVLEAIQPIIPIKFEKITLAIKIPPGFAAHGSSVIRNFSAPTKEEWTRDGSYICTIKILAGLQPELFDKLNSLTHGEVQIKILK